MTIQISKKPFLTVEEKKILLENQIDFINFLKSFHAIKQIAIYNDPIQSKDRRKFALVNSFVNKEISFHLFNLIKNELI